MTENKKMKLKTLATVALLSVNLTSNAVFTIDMQGSPETPITGGATGSSYFNYTFTTGHAFKNLGYDLYVVNESGDRVNESENPFSLFGINAVSTMKLDLGTHYIVNKPYVLEVDYQVKNDVTVDRRWGIMLDLYVNQPSEPLVHLVHYDYVNTYSIPEPSSMSLGMLGGCMGLCMIFRKKVV